MSNEGPPRSRWKAWLPPVLIVVVIVVALIAIGPDGSGPIFRYKLF